MATDLLDLLKSAKQRLASGVGAASATPPPATSNLAQAQGLSGALQNRAPATPGGPGGGPRASNVQETVANEAAQAKTADVVTQGTETQRALGLAATRTEDEARASESTDRLAALTLAEAHSTREAELLEKGRQAQAKGDQAELESILDQAQFNRRLGNEQYVQTLQQQGALQRLGDKVGFLEALQRDVFADEQTTLEQYLGWKDVMASDDRAFQERLGAIDVNAALAIASSKAEQANVAAQAASASTLVSAGAKGYEKREEGAFDSDYKNYSKDQEAAGERPLSYATWKSEGATNG